MAKFMVTASYTAEGSRGLAKEGGSGRRAAVKKLVEGLGGKVEAFYFAYGVHDAVVIVRSSRCHRGARAEPRGQRFRRRASDHHAAHHAGGNGRGVEEDGFVQSSGRVSPAVGLARLDRDGECPRSARLPRRVLVRAGVVVRPSADDAGSRRRALEQRASAARQNVLSAAVLPARWFRRPVRTGRERRVPRAPRRNRVSRAAFGPGVRVRRHPVRGTSPRHADDLRDGGVTRARGDGERAGAGLDRMEDGGRGRGAASSVPSCARLPRRASVPTRYLMRSYTAVVVLLSSPFSL